MVRQKSYLLKLVQTSSLHSTSLEKKILETHRCNREEKSFVRSMSGVDHFLFLEDTSEYLTKQNKEFISFGKEIPFLLVFSYKGSLYYASSFLENKKTEDYSNEEFCFELGSIYSLESNLNENEYLSEFSLEIDLENFEEFLKK